MSRDLRGGEWVRFVSCFWWSVGGCHFGDDGGNKSCAHAGGGGGGGCWLVCKEKVVVVVVGCVCKEKVVVVLSAKLMDMADSFFGPVLCGVEVGPSTTCLLNNDKTRGFF